MTHPSTVADTLDAAADLLSKPGAWTRNPVDAWGDKATTQWNVWTIVFRAARYASRSDAAMQLLTKVAYDPTGHPRFGQSQEADVALLREAVAKARGEAQP